MSGEDRREPLDAAGPIMDLDDFAELVAEPEAPVCFACGAEVVSSRTPEGDWACGTGGTCDTLADIGRALGDADLGGRS